MPPILAAARRARSVRRLLLRASAPRRIVRARDASGGLRVPPQPTGSYLRKELDRKASALRVNPIYARAVLPQSDARRLFQLVKSTSRATHPFCKFSTGNLETLETSDAHEQVRAYFDRDSLGDMRPIGMRSNVVAQVRRFYETHYSADAMSACLLGRESLDELESMAVDAFGHVAAREPPLHGGAASEPAEHGGASSEVQRRRGGRRYVAAAVGEAVGSPLSDEQMGSVPGIWQMPHHGDHLPHMATTCLIWQVGPHNAPGARVEATQARLAGAISAYLGASRRISDDLA